ncbi:MAG TPA: GntR family transcriptional regulator [Anaerolineales bacterium]|nr:GntR family transcriptional regulator [Anaerolineales bacterium]
MLRLAKSERKTLTEVAQQELRQAITRGTFRPGSQLPTEAELCEMLGVSRTVVREALRVLEDDGLVARRHGVGTFVRNHPILKNLNFNFGITEMIESAGLKPGTSHLAIQTENADQEKAEQLRVAVGTPLITVERVRTADGRPVVYSLDTLTESLLQRADFDPQLLRTASIYNVLQTSLGQVIEYGIARLMPVAAPDHVSEKLQLPPNALTLYIVQTDYSSADEPLVYSCEYHLPDEFDFMVWRRGPTRLQGSPGDGAQ